MSNSNLSLINQIELHYYFNDESHSLNAFTKNKCAAEFLYIVKEVLEVLELDINIETIALKEGGLKEIWEFIGNNSNQIIAISGIVALIITYNSLADTELTELQKTEIKLKIEKHKLEIKKLDNNFNNVNINDIAMCLNSNNKIIKHRSSFYETLTPIEKITKISTSKMYNNKLVEVVKTIEKKDFYQYIVSEKEEPIEIIEDAKLEIISPILKQQGNTKWKGQYKGDIISFYMKDNDFKQSILNQEILFQNGFYIKCVLEIKKATDELGNIKIKQYSVLTVLSTQIMTNKEIEEQETTQGQKYLKQKKENLSQLSLFD